MSKKNLKSQFLIIMLLPLSLFTSIISSLNPKEVEHLYSNGINKLVREALSISFGILPFSVAEIIVITLFIYSISSIIYLISNIIKEKNKIYILLWSFMNLAAAVSIICFLFLFTWGLNYYRPTFADLTGLPVHKSSITELGKLCETLINTTNTLRNEVKESKAGTMYIPAGKKSVLPLVSSAYKNITKSYPVLKGIYGKPKGVLFSKAMSYAGISGVYFPFTGEPNVNMDIPYCMIPCTACHEAAHQHGFAREDEANFIAYLVCSSSTNINFKYSGNLLALIYCMNALYNYDTNKYYILCKKYSPKLNRDLKENNKYWDKFEGPIEKISNSINNTYLKANGQTKGVYSYGRMVDLLLALQSIKKL